MYKIIGGDGREYGPISADQVREWMRQGRANARTKVKPEGATEWTELGKLPEFADPPPHGTDAAATFANASPGGEADLLTREYDLDVMGCFSRGWALLQKDFWAYVGVTALMVLLSSASTMLPLVGPLLFTYVLFGGLDWYYLKRLRGEPVELSDAFVGFGPQFVPLMLFSLILQVLILLGLVLCILPGIYVMIIWSMFPALLIIDKGMDFWPAMELSRKMVQKHFWSVTGLFLLALLLVLVGTLACLIGLFITLPIATAAVVCAYEDVFGERRKLLPPEPDAPPAPTQP